MKQMTGLFKKLQLRKILTVFLAGALLFLSTACNPGDARGARPNNPPVQAGGANNPYKGGGDGYTNFNSSTDPRINNQTGKERADLQLNSERLIADSQHQELLYPGAEAPAGTFENGKKLPIKTAKDAEKPQPGGLIQRQENLGDRISDRLEKVQEAFSEASEFLTDKSEEIQKGGEPINTVPKTHK
jgi:hypothetical protein